MFLVPRFWAFCNFMCQVWIRLRYRVEVIVDGDAPNGPALILAKHGRGVDIPLVGDRCRRLRGSPPYSQMGSFVGYPLLGPLVPIFRRLGGFSVMRPKEVRRLAKRRGWDRRRALERMKGINAEAERTRRAILESDGALVVFPEGTRDEVAVRPLVADLEVRSALAVQATTQTQAWPVVISYGRRRFPRRRVVVDFRPPFMIEGDDPARVLEAVARVFASRWIPPDAVDGVRPAPSGTSLAGEDPS